MRTIAIIFSLALVASVFGAANIPQTSTATTNSITAASFNSTPDKVLDVTNTSVLTTVYDGSWFSANYQYGIFGPGSTNTTLYLWGFGSTTASPPVLNLIVRTISATIAGYGNDTLEAAAPSGTADASSTVTAVGTLRQTSPIYAVGPAMVGLATVQAISATVDAILFYVGTPTGLGAAKTIVTSSTPTTVSAVTTSYSYAVNNVWYEDGYFYILYESQNVLSSATGTINVAGLYVQAVLASGTTLLYTAAMPAATSVAATSAALGTPATAAKSQNSNYTNSTSIYVIYNDVASTYVVVKGSILTRSTGTATTTSTVIATGSATASYYAGGIITWNGTANAYGWLVGSYASSAASVMAYYNTNTTATSLSLTLTGASLTSGKLMGSGMNYGTGYFVVAGYQTSATALSIIAQTYYYNGTANTTVSSQVTLGSFSTTTLINTFADANGALWFGYVVMDNAASPAKINSAYVGKLYGQINATTTNSTFGNVLTTFAALLSFVIVSLFMF